MENTNHFNEPWPTPVLDFDANEALILLPYGYVSCGGSRAQREANARRIVAAINACAGLSTELLEHSSFLDLLTKQAAP